MSRINPTPKERQFDEGRLMQVLVAPIDVRKGHDGCRKIQCRHLQGAAERHQA
jgi:hypothetical protein